MRRCRSGFRNAQKEIVDCRGYRGFADPGRVISGECSARASRCGDGGSPGVWRCNVCKQVTGCVLTFSPQNVSECGGAGWVGGFADDSRIRQSIPARWRGNVSRPCRHTGTFRNGFQSKRGGAAAPQTPVFAILSRISRLEPNRHIASQFATRSEKRIYETVPRLAVSIDGRFS